MQSERNFGSPTKESQDPPRLTPDLLAETLQARREWGPIFTILKEKNFQPRISYPAKLSFISEGEINSFTDKRFLHHQTCPTRAPEGSTKHRKKHPVPKTAKMNQMVKTNDAMRKLRRPTAKQTTSNKMAGSNSHITILT